MVGEERVPSTHTTSFFFFVKKGIKAQTRYLKFESANEGGNLVGVEREVVFGLGMGLLSYFQSVL